MEKSLLAGLHYDPESLGLPEPGDTYLYKDGLVPFLYLKVTAQSRAWLFVKNFNGKAVKRKIGKSYSIGLPEARLKAYEWARELEVGNLPPTVEERRREAVCRSATVAQLFERYYSDHLMHEARTHEEIRRGFNKYWKDIKDRQAVSVSSEIAQKWVNAIGTAHGKPTATKQFTHLRACLRYAEARSWTKLAPDGLRLVKTYKSPKSELTLKIKQVPALNEALQTETQDIQDAVWLCLWTCQRKGNVLAMEWSEIDWDSKTWIVPPHKTKSKRTYKVALTPKAIQILERRKEFCEHHNSNFVFASKRAVHLKHINKAWLGVRKRAKLGKLRVHDLRHTGASWLADIGAPSSVIKDSLQHSSLQTSENYIHSSRDSVRDYLIKAQDLTATS